MGFQQGLSGLNVSARNLEVIGNNVANTATFGAKTARAEFSDMYAAALNGSGNNNIGIGAMVSTVAQQFTQGNITTTENPMDLAINGGGFCQLSDGQGPPIYSRNGQFKLNREGFIVNNEGHKLLGYQADKQGTIIPAQATALQLPTSGIEPNRTDKISLEMTFDSRSKIATGTGINFDDPNSYNFATSQTVFDQKGQDIGLTYYMRKTSADNWDVFVTANGTSIQQDGAGDPMRIASITFAAAGGNPTTSVPGAVQGDPGTITTYDAAGNPLSTSSDGFFAMPDIPSVAMASGAMTEIISGIQFNMSKSAEYGASFAVTNLSQTGYSPGQLSSINIEQNGIVMARYSNGQSKPAGQIELATFRNPQGLQPLGGNEWTATYASGDPVMGIPGDGNMGVLQSGALEESNVDLTGELVNMIVAQRMYQANAQTIKTEDQVLQTLVNLR
jgi:flagellar hook protein FlgE